jgi:hypothetical protein
MPERVDLDAVQARYEAAIWFNAAGPSESMRTVLESVQDVPALVAELRDAREVINQARLQSRPHAYLRRALITYDQASSS